ncbi:hypothetical protein ABZ297_10775, partial [Nonomuraea sp. NPDC005983]|uniref:hypothetical protein n=1 Tax=Nonomuraea sp. NPDC005983 TaxID=3155595 RepID=UPI0033A63CDF
APRPARAPRPRAAEPPPLSLPRRHDRGSGREDSAAPPFWIRPRGASGESRGDEAAPFWLRSRNSDRD